MIVEYTVVEATDDYDLIQFVNNFIDEGWRPFGGVCVISCIDGANGGSYERYAQAMVKDGHRG